MPPASQNIAGGKNKMQIVVFNLSFLVQGYGAKDGLSARFMCSRGWFDESCS